MSPLVAAGGRVDVEAVDRRVVGRHVRRRPRSCRRRLDGGDVEVAAAHVVRDAGLAQPVGVVGVGLAGVALVAGGQLGRLVGRSPAASSAAAVSSSSDDEQAPTRAAPRGRGRPAAVRGACPHRIAPRRRRRCIGGRSASTGRTSGVYPNVSQATVASRCDSDDPGVRGWRHAIRHLRRRGHRRRDRRAAVPGRPRRRRSSPGATTCGRCRRRASRWGRPTGRRRCPSPRSGHPGEADLRDGDVVVLAMKSQDTAGGARPTWPGWRRPASPCCAPRTAWRTSAWRCGCSPTSTPWPSCCRRPISSRASSWPTSAPVTGLLDLGRYPEGVDAAAEEVAAALSGATFGSVARPDIMRWKYRKLVLNLGNAVEARVRSRAAGVEPARPGWPAPRARRPARRPASTGRPSTRTGPAAATCCSCGPIEGRAPEGGSSWQSLARGTGSDRDRLPQRRDRAARPAARGADPGQRAAPAARPRGAAEGRPPGGMAADDVLARLECVCRPRPGHPR